MANANFTRDEKVLFAMRNNERSLEECAELMDYSVSTISRMNKKILTKISKVIKDRY